MNSVERLDAILEAHCQLMRNIDAIRNGDVEFQGPIDIEVDDEDNLVIDDTIVGVSRQVRDEWSKDWIGIAEQRDNGLWYGRISWRKDSGGWHYVDVNIPSLTRDEAEELGEAVYKEMI